MASAKAGGRPLASARLRKTVGEIAEIFFGGKMKERILAHDDRAGVANARVRGHEDLVAAQRHNRRPADRLAGNIGHGVRPVQFLQALGESPGFPPASRPGCRFPRSRRSAPCCLAASSLRKRYVSSPGRISPSKADDDSMVILDRLLGRTVGSGHRSSRRSQTEKRSRRLFKDLPFERTTRRCPCGTPQC